MNRHRIQEFITKLVREELNSKINEEDFTDDDAQSKQLRNTLDQEKKQYNAAALNYYKTKISKFKP
jgi:hypothetical protein